MKNQSGRRQSSGSGSPRDARAALQQLGGTASAIDKNMEELFGKPAFAVAALALALSAALLLRLDLFQDGLIRLGALVKGAPLDTPVWHARFERCGLALATSPAVILLAVHAAKTLARRILGGGYFDTAFLCMAYLAYLALAACTALRHEPWLDQLFLQSQEESIYLILSKTRLEDFSYPASHRWERLYESPEIIAIGLQYTLLKVYPTPPDEAH